MKCQQTEKSKQAEENRKRYPITAQIVDEVREVFGNGVSVKSTNEKANYEHTNSKNG